MSAEPRPTPGRDTLRSLIERLFVERGAHRPRAAWRLLAHGALALSLMTCLSIPLILVPGALQPGPVSMEVLGLSSVGGAIGITLATVIARRWLDRRSFRSLGLQFDRSAAADLAVGFLIPAAQMGLVFLLEVALGWSRWEGWAWEAEPPALVLGGLGLSLGTFVLVGWQEELLSRGYHLQNLIEAAGLPWAIGISSAIFALLHLGNPGAGLASTLGLVAAGLFLAYAYLRTGRLWLSIGLHVGWNFFEGTVFGFPVSGLDLFRLMRHTVDGPGWATGGGFGPEAGAVMLPAYALGLLLVRLYTARPRPDSLLTR